MTTYNFPGKKDVLGTPIKVPDSNIEIIRPFDGNKITSVLFDYDETLSTERSGWPNLMISSNSAILIQALPNITSEEAASWVIKDIEESIGIPTYTQMKRLAKHIEDLGGNPKDPQKYKNIYNEALKAMVTSRHEKLKSKEITKEDLRVKGSLDFLKKLSLKFNENLYLASGTDVSAIKQSAELLNYHEFFKENIVGAGSTNNPEQCAKQSVINKLVNEKNLKPGQLVCFGDGFPEILHTYHAGGICVGLLTPDKSNYESQGHFTIKQKRERLINAGAHILIPNFSDAEKLIQLITSKYP